MKIVIIGYGDIHTASHRFRFQAYEDLFRADGMELIYVFKSQIKTHAFWEAIVKADIIINQKSILRRQYAKKIFALGKPVIFDFDDAIWTRPSKPYSWLTQIKVDRRLAYWLQNASAITVANQYLANYAKRYNDTVEVIPMGLDFTKWTCKPKPQSPSITLGWNGSPNNLPMLERIADPLRISLERHPNLKLKVFCGRKPSFAFPYEYVPFSPGTEVQFVQSLDIGLLPLEPNDYDHGKSPIKGLQYMACAVPIVGVANKGADYAKMSSFIPVTETTPWVEAIMKMSEDLNIFQQSAKLNRKNKLYGYSIVSIYNKLKSLYQNITLQAKKQQVPSP